MNCLIPRIFADSSANTSREREDEDALPLNPETPNEFWGGVLEVLGQEGFADHKFFQALLNEKSNFKARIKQVAELFIGDAPLAEGLTDPSPSRYTNLPGAAEPKLIDHADLIQELDRRLNPTGPLERQTSPRRVGLWGAPGCGKSFLARTWARSRPFKQLLYVDLGPFRNADDALRQIAELASDPLQLDAKASLSTAERLEKVRSTLEGPVQRILILDNVALRHPEERQKLDAALPAYGGTAIVFVLEDKDCPLLSLDHLLEVRALGPKDASAFLMRAAPNWPEDQLLAISELAERIGGLPVVLSVAARLLVILSPSDLLSALKQLELDMLSQERKIESELPFLLDRTLKRAEADPAGANAMHLLSVAIWFAGGTPIEGRLLKKAFLRDAGEVSESSYFLALKLLNDLGLLHRDSPCGEGWVTQRSLLPWLKRRLAPDTHARDAMLDVLAEEMERLKPWRASDLASYVQWLPHLIQAGELLAQDLGGGAASDARLLRIPLRDVQIRICNRDFAEAAQAAQAWVNRLPPDHSWRPWFLLEASRARSGQREYTAAHRLLGQALETSDPATAQGKNQRVTILIERALLFSLEDPARSLKQLKQASELARSGVADPRVVDAKLAFVRARIAENADEPKATSLAAKAVRRAQALLTAEGPILTERENFDKDELLIDACQLAARVLPEAEARTLLRDAHAMARANSAPCTERLLDLLSSLIQSQSQKENAPSDTPGASPTNM